MFKDFRSSCAASHHEVMSKVLFGSIECLVRESLLSLGFAHGVPLGGAPDCMCDALILHLSWGDCASKSGMNNSRCQAIVHQYLMDSELFNNDFLHICILDAVCQLIRLLPLRLLL